MAYRASHCTEQSVIVGTGTRKKRCHQNYGHDFTVVDSAAGDAAPQYRCNGCLKVYSSEQVMIIFHYCLCFSFMENFIEGR